MTERVHRKSPSNGGNGSWNGGSNPRNSPKKPTHSLGDALLVAAEAVGDPDRQCRGGLVGYLKYLAVNDLRTFGMLLATHLRQSADSHAGESSAKDCAKKLTPSLGDALLIAAEAVGDPNKGGRGGLVGYLKYLAVKDPRTFGMLLDTKMRQSADSHVQKPRSRIHTPGQGKEITLENVGKVFDERIESIARRFKEGRELGIDKPRKPFQSCQALPPAS
jgi:hypothetical protein